MADTSRLPEDHTRRRPSERTVRRLLLRPAGAIRPGTVHADASSRPLLLTNSGNRLETHAALPWRSPRLRRPDRDIPSSPPARAVGAPSGCSTQPRSACSRLVTGR
jgi:hypothetical protein